MLLEHFLILSSRHEASQVEIAPAEGMKMTLPRLNYVPKTLGVLIVPCCKTPAHWASLCLKVLLWKTYCKPNAYLRCIL